MQRGQEIIAGALAVLSLLVLAFSSMLDLTEVATTAMVATLSAATAWVFRGRLNGTISESYTAVPKSQVVPEKCPNCDYTHPNLLIVAEHARATHGIDIWAPVPRRDA